MGCDGGTIPRRDELVRTKKKPEQKDKDAEAVARWKHCCLSQDELKPPVVSCELGRLYNKEAVIQYLLDKSKEVIAQHIRNLKDVLELNLTPNPVYSRTTADKGDEYVDHQKSPFICPVVGMEMNGKHRFCFLWSCGCALSEKALKEVKAENCHKCGKPFTEDDVIVINGSDDDIALLRIKMDERRLKAKMEKKLKKESSKQKRSVNGNHTEVSEGPTVIKQVKFSKVRDNNEDSSSGESVDKSKLVNNGASGSSSSKSYSIAKDPSKSEAFKSLFTSHSSFKQQPKAHWVTYNPLYN